MVRTVPITMATQHPDNAAVPWWREGSSDFGSAEARAFIPTQDEIDELTLLFQELPIDEYMWDWEGKYVDEAVGEKLFARAQSLFAKRPLGEEIHLTYRIPAFDGESMHRMARAMMNVLSLSDLAHDLRLKHPPVTEMFLPLTTSADQPKQVRRAFKEVAKFHKAIFHAGKKRDTNILETFNVTPLIEDLPSLIATENILGSYWKSLLKERPSIRTHGQRVFFGRSDPALNAGLIPAVLAIKLALSQAHQLGDDLGMPVYPIIGTGSLPFRGSVNPTYTDVFLKQYAGVRTYSIQSAFRYDYPKAEVTKALKRIRDQVPKLKVVHVPPKDRAAILGLAKDLSELWKTAIESLAPLINGIAPFVPPRRERVQHIGLFGYNRGVGKVKLPRAITFTAALYSIGIPPEIITTGRGLLRARAKGRLDLIHRYYPALKDDLMHAGKYVNRENIAMLVDQYPALQFVLDDIEAIEDVFNIELGPEKPHHLIHRNLTSTICHRLTRSDDPEAIRHDIVEAGKIRRSLG